MNLHRGRKRDRFVPNHLARTKVLKAGVNGHSSRTTVALNLKLSRLARITNLVGAGRMVFLAGAQRRRSGLATKVVFQIDNVAFDLRHCRTANNAQFHPALVAVFVFDWVEGVRKRTGALVELFLVRARIIH